MGDNVNDVDIYDNYIVMETDYIHVMNFLCTYIYILVDVDIL